MNKDLIYIAIVAAVIGYFLLFPIKEVDIEIEYIPGDTVTTVDTVVVKDTVVAYKFRSVRDTIETTDTIYVAYTAPFRVGDSILGTSGKVTFALEEFTFKDIEYTYPEFTNTVVDTLRETRTENPPIYKNIWFWSTAAAVSLLFFSLAGG